MAKNKSIIKYVEAQRSYDAAQRSKSKNVRDSVGSGGPLNCTFAIKGATAITVKYNTPGSLLEYSLDDGNSWVEINSGDTITVTSADGITQLRGSGRTSLYNSMDDEFNPWTIVGDEVEILGNINKLLDYENPPNALGNYAFANMFEDCTNIISPPTLPAIELGKYCYAYMFQHCTHLIHAPVLPAIAMEEGCYFCMFSVCWSLEEPPALPSYSLAVECYAGMFMGCEVLKYAPALPAQGLAIGCYSSMFSGCVNILEAPSLPTPPASPFNDKYYDRMFYQCWELTTAPRCDIYTSYPDIKQAEMFTGCTNITEPISWCEIPTSWGGGGNTNCFFSITGATQILPKYGTPGSPLQYSLDNGKTWTNIDSGIPIENITGRVRFRGSGRKGLFTVASSQNSWVLTGTNVKCTGNIMQLLDYQNPPTEVAADGFCYMFTGNQGLVKAPALPALTVGDRGYLCMFLYCVSLAELPDLPATTIGVESYLQMFLNCNKAVTGPSLLPADIVPTRGYYTMFSLCTSLITPPNILASNVSPYGCMLMFNGCTSLVNAPALPATTLGDHCYYNMFTNCAGITRAPELPALEVPESAYSYMFQNCTNLTRAPDILPATTLSYGCYVQMFQNCTNLLVAPELSVTNLINFCYAEMFWNCSNLTTAPGNDVYTKLQPAQTNMFRNCNKLIRPLPLCAVPTTWGGGGDNCPYLVIDNALSVTPVWTVSGLRLEYKLGAADWEYATSGSSITVNSQTIKFRGRGRTGLFAYDTINNAWTITGNGVVVSGSFAGLLDYTTAVPTVDPNCFCNMFRGCTSIVTVTATLPANTLGDRSYAYMFYGCTSLITVPALPAENLGTYCYFNMFRGDVSITDAPALNSLILVGGCYVGMFEDCTGLINAPGCDVYTSKTPSQNYMFTGAVNVQNPMVWADIPTTFGGGGVKLFEIVGATTIEVHYTNNGTGAGPLEYKYRLASQWVSIDSGQQIHNPDGNPVAIRGSNREGLFTSADASNAWHVVGENVRVMGDIRNLLDYTTPPSNMAPYAFAYMFYNCVNIVLGPELLAQNMHNSSYESMFRGCTGLYNAPNLDAMTLDTNCYKNMFMGCVSLTRAPELRESVLYDGCYEGMFSGCTNIEWAPYCDIYTKRVPAQANMFTGCNSIYKPLTWCEIPLSWGGGGKVGNCADFFTIVDATSVTPKWTVTGNALEYRIHSGTWTAATSGTAIPTSGYAIQFRGTGRTALFTADSILNSWVIAGTNVMLSGNIQTLLDYQNPPTSVGIYGFSRMFQNCTSIVSCPELPAITLGQRAYSSMFTGCSNLMSLPSSLPATTFAQYCYGWMFQNCTSLVEVNLTLTFDTAISYVAGTMFANCTSMVKGPTLVVNTLNMYCLVEFFKGCTSLIEAPNADIYTAKKPVQADFFTGCTNLNDPLLWCEIPSTWGGGANCKYIKIFNSTSIIPKFTTIEGTLEYSLTEGAANTWVTASSGTLITTGRPIMFRGSGKTSLYTGAAPSNAWVINGRDVAIRGNFNALLDYNTVPTTIGAFAFAYMFSGCTSIKSIAAILPATTLATNCYSNMFSGCTKLEKAPNLLADLVTGCYVSMFKGCTSMVDAPNADVYTTELPAQANMFTGAINVVTPIPWAEIPTSFGGGGSASYDYFTIKKATSVTPRWTVTGSALQYKIGDGTWTDSTSGTAISTGNKDIKFRGSGRTTLYTANSAGGNAWTIAGTDVVLSGNFNILLDYATPPTTVGTFCFANMFRGCNSIKYVYALLPATIVGANAYISMYQSCANIVTVQEILPAMDIGSNCYQNMYAYCPSIIAAPELPATIVKNNSYDSMFYGCTSLITAPALPGTGLSNFCYSNMFNGCTNLINIPETLPSKVMPSYGYNGMFQDCTSIEKSPELPATSMGPNVYQAMFKGCINLVNGPTVLPATALTNSCYANMFNGCKKLVNVPVILGTSITNMSCQNMFASCINLVNAPALPIKSLADDCYAGMFSSCINLINAPNSNYYTTYEPAQAGMFTGCTNVAAPLAWVDIPTSWGGGCALPCYNYFRIDNATSVTPKYTVAGDSLQYKLGQGDWTNVASNTLINTSGNTIRFRGSGRNTLYVGNSASGNRWYVNGSNIIMKGNVNTLLDYQNPPTTLGDYTFSYAFNTIAGLVDASDLILPATTFSSFSYRHMFAYCSALIKAPRLPDVITPGLTCQSMFSDCTSLTTVPNADVYTTKGSAQSNMFYNCNNIVNPLLWCAIPTNWGGGGGCTYFELLNTTSVTPVWTSVGSDLEYKLGTADWVAATSGISIVTNDVVRFRGIGRTSLFTDNAESNAWVIEGTDVIINGNFNKLLDYTNDSLLISEYAFSYLLYNCESIKKVNATLPSTVLAERCYYSMFRGCTNLLVAPALPATELVKYCYYYMFMDCTSLTEAPGDDRYTKYEPSQGAMFGNCRALLKPISYSKITDLWK